MAFAQFVCTEKVKCLFYIFFFEAVDLWTFLLFLYLFLSLFFSIRVFFFWAFHLKNMLVYFALMCPRDVDHYNRWSSLYRGIIHVALHILVNLVEHKWYPLALAIGTIIDDIPNRCEHFCNTNIRNEGDMGLICIFCTQTFIQITVLYRDHPFTKVFFVQYFFFWFALLSVLLQAFIL